MDDKVFDLQKIDSIRKTMLMQNHTFTQQVIELHKLYEHQKKLMDELKKEVTITSKQINSSDTNILHQTMPIQEMEHNNIVLNFVPRDESPSTSTRIGMESNRTRHYHSYGLQNVYKFKVLNNDDDDDEEVDVELSLSIGCSRSSKKRLRSNGCTQMGSCSMDLGSTEIYSNGGGPRSCAINTRVSVEQSLGESGLDLSISSGKLNQNVPPSIWFCSRS